ncbi:LysR substrate-binding domain-containing protein [Verticiella sediminum]
MKLGVSQSAASRQIKALEEDLHTKLFYRHGRGVALTDAGRKLYLAVRPLLAQLSEVRELLLEESEQPTGSIVVGMPASLMGTIGASLAQIFLHRYPKVSLHLYEGSSGLLVERLESGLIGGAVLYDIRRGPNMLIAPLLEEQLFLVEAWRGDGDDSSLGSLEELSRFKLILPGGLSGLRRTIEAAFHAGNIVSPVLMEMHSVTVVKHLVEKGVGSTILPFGAVYREVGHRYLSARPIPYEIMSARLGIATATGQPLTRAMRVFIQLLKEEVHRCLAGGSLRGRTYQ